MVEHRALRSRLFAALAFIGLGTLPLAIPSPASADDAVPVRRVVIDEVGTGTSRPDPCLDREGRCGFVLSGSLDGQPADETFFSVIDDDGRADHGGCVRAHYAGLLGDGPDQSIGHVADGKLCPDGSGGFVFEGRFKITGGLGPFEGARGRGDIAVTFQADGPVTLTAIGRLRLPG